MRMLLAYVMVGVIGLGDIQAQGLADALFRTNQYYDCAESLEMTILHEIYMKGDRVPSSTLESKFVRKGSSYSLETNQTLSLVGESLSIGVDKINRVIMVGKGSTDVVSGPSSMDEMLVNLKLYKKAIRIKSGVNELAYRFVPKLKMMPGHDSTDIHLAADDMRILKMTVYLSDKNPKTASSGATSLPKTPEKLVMRYTSVKRDTKVDSRRLAPERVFRDVKKLSLRPEYAEYRLLNTLKTGQL